VLEQVGSPLVGEGSKAHRAATAHAGSGVRGVGRQFLEGRERRQLPRVDLDFLRDEVAIAFDDRAELLPVEAVLRGRPDVLEILRAQARHREELASQRLASVVETRQRIQLDALAGAEARKALGRTFARRAVARRVLLRALLRLRGVLGGTVLRRLSAG